MINTYTQLFILNPILCVLILWLLFKLCLHRLLKQLTDKKLDEIVRKLLPPDEIAAKLVPIAKDIRKELPKMIPGWIKFFGRGWYKKVKVLAETLSDRKELREFIEVILEEVNLPQIIKNNIEKPKPSVVQLFIVKTIRPWIILGGTIISILIGIVQLGLQF